MALSTYLIPRALVVVLESTFGRTGRALVDEWESIASVLFGGSIWLAVIDPALQGSGTMLLQRMKRVVGLTRTGVICDIQKLDSTSPERSETSSLSRTLSRSRARSGDDSTHSAASTSLAFVALPLLPLLLLVSRSLWTASLLEPACRLFPFVRTALCPPSPLARTVDIVFAFYDEPLEAFKLHRDAILARPFVRDSDTKTIVYNKGSLPNDKVRTALDLGINDEVVKLDNVGREGGTYLRHILLHYNDTLETTSPVALAPHRQARVLADHTFFQQPHLAWPDTANPRMDAIDVDTGFAGLGPLLRSDCGFDTLINADFVKIKELYSAFAGELCPPGGQLVSSMKRLPSESVH